MVLQLFARYSSGLRALRLCDKIFQPSSAKSIPPAYSAKRAPALKIFGEFGKRMATHSSAVQDSYPTRYVTEQAVLPRVDPVVWGRHGQDGLLTQADFDHFEKHGFVILKDVLTGKSLRDLTQDVMSRRDEIEEDLAVTERDNNLGECRSGFYVSEGKSRRLRSLFQTVRHVPLVNKLARYPPLLASIKQLLNDNVYLSQDRINFHAAFEGEGFDWHSDFETWHSEDGIPRPRTVNAIVMLSTNVSHNGALMVMPGTHKVFVSCPGVTPGENWLSSLQFQGQYYGIPNHTTLRELGEKYGITYCTGEPGTVVLTDSNLLHGSHSNIFHLGRCNIFLVYNAVSNKPGTPYGGTMRRPEYLDTRDPEWQKPLTPFDT